MTIEIDVGPVMAAAREYADDAADRNTWPIPEGTEHPERDAVEQAARLVAIDACLAVLARTRDELCIWPELPSCNECANCYGVNDLLAEYEAEAARLREVEA